MAGFFIVDAETLGTKAKSVVLSMAICYVDLDVVKEFTALELLKHLRETSLFVKLNAKTQLDKGMTSDKYTLEWWKDQTKETQQKSLVPHADDLDPVDAITQVREYILKYNGKGKHMFGRGSMDELVINALCEVFEVAPITHWGNWRDVRTAIDILYGTHFGYCEVDGISKEKDIIKHDPVDDIAYDCVMMLMGKENGV